eukprot:TRINITY_DN4195_c1_g1_i5.p1 TRINITY_DN4195_c1_g1~~TRINITY_DN4195_c1_g1_i5.p1  ORF type:complete len:209 (-),score=31.12 TRINITY_DN4195_c1_g1_i5:19-645(-)
MNSKIIRQSIHLFDRVFGMIIEDLAICPSTIVFGLTVEEAAKKTDRSLGLLPSPIKDCIEFIEQGKRWSDDLYVASGSWIEIEDYRAKYDRGENVTFDQHTDVDTVAGILKYYIYEIPENLFTHKLKEQFWAVAELPEDQKLPTLKKLVSQLPPCQYSILSLMLPHLLRVCNNSRGNIKPFHLGYCFGGTYKQSLPVVVPYAFDLFTE